MYVQNKISIFFGGIAIKLVTLFLRLWIQSVEEIGSKFFSE
jgi:hypothetical protein